MMKTIFSLALTGVFSITGAGNVSAFTADSNPSPVHAIIDENFSAVGNWCDGTYSIVADFGSADGSWGWTKDGVAIAGATSNELNIVHLGTGTYAVTWLSADGSTVIHESVEISNVPGPSSHFVYLNDLPIGATRYADNSVAGDVSIVSWHWDFGDGSSSTEQNPVHFYPGAGARTFNVVLTTTDSNGCSNSWTGIVEWE